MIVGAPRIDGVLAFEAEDGDQGGHLPGGSTQKLAVLHTGPAQALHRHNLVTGELYDEIVRKILVKQNAHW